MVGRPSVCSVVRARETPAQWEEPRSENFADKLFKVVNLRARNILLKSLRNRGLTHMLSNLLRFFFVCTSLV